MAKQEIAVSTGDQLPAVETIQDMMAKAEILLKSGFLPDAIKKPEQVVVIMEVAKNINVPAIHALNSVHVIKGKPTMSAELMRALIFRKYPTALFEIVEQSDIKCQIKAARPGGKPQVFEFTIKQAEKAGIAKKDSWKNYPEAMLFARATSKMARAIFPEVGMGTSYTPEEMGAEVNKDGEITKLPPEDEIVKAFVDIGVTKEELNDYCTDKYKHPTADITLDEVGELRTIWNDIVHQGATKESYFKTKPQEPETPPITVEGVAKSAPTPEEQAAIATAEKAVKEEEKPPATTWTEKDYHEFLEILKFANIKKYLPGRPYAALVNGALKFKTDFSAKVNYFREELGKQGFDIVALFQEYKEWANATNR